MLISNVHKSIIVMNSLDTLFQECFWSHSKNSQHVFYRVKNHSATPRGFKPDKTLLLVFYLSLLLLLLLALLSQYYSKVVWKRLTSIWWQMLPPRPSLDLSGTNVTTVFGRTFELCSIQWSAYLTKSVLKNCKFDCEINPSSLVTIN